MRTPSNRSVQKGIQDGFLTLPKGCYIQLEKVAQSYILANIKSHFGRKSAFVARISTFEESSGLSLAGSSCFCSGFCQLIALQLPMMSCLCFMKPNTVREDVKYLPEKKSDLFFITLNKSEKFYSPTTMYHDYSINDRTII